VLKVGAITVAIILVGFVVLHRSHGSNAAGHVRSCLNKTGATVKQSTLFEDIFASAAAEQGETVPEPMQKTLREVEKRLYDVDYAGSSALLIFTNGGRQADSIELQLSQLGELADMGPSQRFGKVLVLWTEAPTTAASSAVTGCLA
jgi:hypothetical protein